MSPAVRLFQTPRYTLPQRGSPKQNLLTYEHVKNKRDEPCWLAQVRRLFFQTSRDSSEREAIRRRLLSIRRAGLPAPEDGVGVHTESFRDTIPGSRIGSVEVLNLELVDALWCTVPTAGNVMVDQSLLLIGGRLAPPRVTGQCPAAGVEQISQFRKVAGIQGVDTEMAMS